MTDYTPENWQDVANQTRRMREDLLRKAVQAPGNSAQKAESIGLHPRRLSAECWRFGICKETGERK